MDFAEHRREALQAAAVATGDFVGFEDYDEDGRHVFWPEAESAVAAFLARLRTPEAMAKLESLLPCCACAFDTRVVLAVLAGDDE